VSWDLTGPVWEIAPTLLGAVLSHGPVSVRLVEVEAYDGATDPASHAYRGRTPRNAVMFGPPGHLYVYFTYGMHYACNVACGPEGVASGVLLRAGEVIEGAEVAQSRRGSSKVRDLARGPGRLAQALGIDRSLNGTALLGGGVVSLSPGAGAGAGAGAGVGPGAGAGSRAGAGSGAELGPGPDASPFAIESGPRVGVSTAADVPWRFWIAGDPHVSAYKRSPRAATT
jgi:DNA-3-methyladenine glycosylase